MSKTEIVAAPGIPQVVITREFAAPVDLVFRAYTDPQLLVQWLGPHDLTMTIDRYDPVDGGKWRYIQHDPQGIEHGFHGLFHGDPSPARIVQTFEYERVPGHVKLDTTTFAAQGHRTVVRTVSSFASVEDRDGMIASGMERGAVDSADRLDSLLATLQDS